jgi:CTP:phosphocholine cytidylyltransferase-like protein
VWPCEVGVHEKKFAKKYSFSKEYAILQRRLLFATKITNDTYAVQPDRLYAKDAFRSSIIESKYNRVQLAAIRV